MTKYPPQSAVFAHNIRRLRQHYGWSQAELARRVTAAGAPLKAGWAAAIEAPGPHERTVSVDRADAFARALGVPVAQLLDGDPWPLLALASERMERAERALYAAVQEHNAARRAVVSAAAADGAPYPAAHPIHRATKVTFG